MARKASSDGALEELRAFGLAYPGAHTKSPWPGHLDLAVKDKTFAYLTLEGEPFSIGCKLPQSVPPRSVTRTFSVPRDSSTLWGALCARKAIADEAERIASENVAQTCSKRILDEKLSGSSSRSPMRLRIVSSKS